MRPPFSTFVFCAVLAALYAFTGRLSFLTQVDDVLVTPVLFIPEGIALAFALRFGPRIWPGIFAGQLALALHQGLAWPPSLAISAINSLEAVGAVWLYRRLTGTNTLYDLRSWLVLQGMVFFILQPFSATLGTLSLVAAGVIGGFPEWVTAWQNWWVGNTVAQSQLTPLLLILMHRKSRRGWAKKLPLALSITAAALWLSLSVLPAGGIGSSLVLFQPLLVGFGLALGLKSVCASSVLISFSFLYATSHGIGPFYRAESTSLLDLNVFLVGISLIGQFLAVLFRQLEDRRQALATRNEDIRLVTEGAKIGFWHRDLRTDEEEWDDQCLQVFGRRREEFNGRWEPCVHPDDLARATAESEIAIRENRRYEVDYRIVWPDGQIRWVRGLGTSLRNDHGEPVMEVGINYDITNLKEAEKSLEEARQRELAWEKRQREELVKKLKTSLAAAGIAHEINQPLSQILLQTDVILRKLQGPGGGSEDVLDSFRKIRSRTEQVVKTVETIRALLGNVATGHRELDLANVIRSALLYLQPEIKRAGVEIRRQGLDLSCPFHGDESQLHLLAVNLLRNAVEAVKSRPESNRTVELSLQASDREVSLRVEDSGPGFTEKMKHLSELPIESTKPEGMGMGLFLVHTAAENHQGRISFGRSSTLGGAKVEVVFPR